MRIRILVVLALLAVVACAAPAAPTTPPTIPAPTTQPTAQAAAPASALACSARYTVPDKDFRPDDPGKLDAATNKPKLVEFYAVW